MESSDPLMFPAPAPGSPHLSVSGQSTPTGIAFEVAGSGAGPAAAYQRQQPVQAPASRLGQRATASYGAYNSLQSSDRGHPWPSQQQQVYCPYLMQQGAYSSRPSAQHAAASALPAWHQQQSTGGNYRHAAQHSYASQQHQEQQHMAAVHAAGGAMHVDQQQQQQQPLQESWVHTGRHQRSSTAASTTNTGGSYNNNSSPRSCRRQQQHWAGGSSRSAGASSSSSATGTLYQPLAQQQQQWAQQQQWQHPPQHPHWQLQQQQYGAESYAARWSQHQQQQQQQQQAQQPAVRWPNAAPPRPPPPPPPRAVVQPAQQQQQQGLPPYTAGNSSMVSAGGPVRTATAVAAAAAEPSRPALISMTAVAAAARQASDRQPQAGSSSNSSSGAGSRSDSSAVTRPGPSSAAAAGAQHSVAPQAVAVPAVASAAAAPNAGHAPLQSAQQQQQQLHGPSVHAASAAASSDGDDWYSDDGSDADSYGTLPQLVDAENADLDYMSITPPVQDAYGPFSISSSSETAGSTAAAAAAAGMTDGGSSSQQAAGMPQLPMLRLSSSSVAGVAAAADDADETDSLDSPPGLLEAGDARSEDGMPQLEMGSEDRSSDDGDASDNGGARTFGGWVRSSVLRRLQVSGSTAAATGSQPGSSSSGAGRQSMTAEAARRLASAPGMSGRVRRQMVGAMLSDVASDGAAPGSNGTERSAWAAMRMMPGAQQNLSLVLESVERDREVLLQMRQDMEQQQQQQQRWQQHQRVEAEQEDAILRLALARSLADQSGPTQQQQQQHIVSSPSTAAAAAAAAASSAADAAVTAHEAARQAAVEYEHVAARLRQQFGSEAPPALEGMRSIPRRAAAAAFSNGLGAQADGAARVAARLSSATAAAAAAAAGTGGSGQRLAPAAGPALVRVVRAEVAPAPASPELTDSPNAQVAAWMQQLLAFSSGANAQQQQQQQGGDASQQAVRQLVESAVRNTRESDARAMAALAGSRALSGAAEGPSAAAAAAAAGGVDAGSRAREGYNDDLAWSTDSWDYDGMPPLLDVPHWEDADGMETGPEQEHAAGIRGGMQQQQQQQQVQQQIEQDIQQQIVQLQEMAVHRRSVLLPGAGGNARGRAGLSASSSGGGSRSAAAGPAAQQQQQQQQQQGYGLEALRALLSETQQQRQSRLLRTAAGNARAEAVSIRANALRDDMVQRMARMSAMFGLEGPDGGLGLGLSEAMMGGLRFGGGRFGGGLSYEQLVNLEDVKVCVPAAVLDSLPRRQVAARTAAADDDDDGMGCAAGDGAAAAAGEVEEVICPVCQCELGGAELVVTLPCSHNFHDGCACQWLSKYSKKCPVCKKEVC